jgi:plastocyanin
VAFREQGDTEVQMAVRSEDAPLLAAPAPQETGGGGGTVPPGPPPCEPEGTELAIAANNLAFDTDCLAAPVGEPFAIEFDNQEAQAHNVALYQAPPPSTTFFQGEIVTGPTTTTYEVDPIDQEGNFYFQCDVHPQMNGTFVVAAAGGAARG